MNIRQFAHAALTVDVDHGAPVFLVTRHVVGGRQDDRRDQRPACAARSGRTRVVALKATGTSSVTELHSYAGFRRGAMSRFGRFRPADHISVRPRSGSDDHFDTMLDMCLAIAADAVLIECGGDILGANVPSFLTRLATRRPDVRVILAASDSLAALGAKSVLADMGLAVTLITGPCTDTPTIQQRTRDLCGIPARQPGEGRTGVAVLIRRQAGTLALTAQKCVSCRMRMSLACLGQGIVPVRPDRGSS